MEEFLESVKLGKVCDRVLRERAQIKSMSSRCCNNFEEV
jgi:hypothetical protein